MIILISVIYVLFIFSIVFTSLFIVTRLQKYSINPRFTKPLIFLFTIITIFLVMINIILFVHIPFADIFYNTNLYY